LIACAMVAAFAMIASPRGATPRFYPDDPIAVDNDRLIDVTGSHKVDLDDYYDFLKNTFALPGDRRNVHAINVNTLDEVPDSSWFTNRIGVRDLTAAELVRGPNREVKFGTGWTVTRGKNRGFQPGFKAVDRSDPSGTVYQLEVDPPAHPEMSSGAEVVGSKFYHAFGYHTVEMYLAEVDPATLEISPKATIKDANGRRPFVRHDLEQILKNAARLPNGHIRVTAERQLGNDDMGRFEYQGTRGDDPNDIYPHEHRRELRGSRVFAAWLDHDDSRALNTMVIRRHENGRAHLQYMLVDFGSTLGSATRFPHDAQSGHEYTIAKRPSLLTLFSFGLYVRPWLFLPDPAVPPAVGRFSAEGFDPRTWVAEYRKTAYDNMRPDDAFWAARIVARFSDDVIRTIVGTGQYSDPATIDILTGTIIKRRDRIKEVYLTAVNPIVNVTLSREGELKFENAALQYGIGGKPDGYALRWSRFDNATDSLTPIGDESTVTDTQARAPSGLLDGSDYVSVRIDTRHPHFPGWVPVQVYFRRTATGWQTVGLDRGLDPKEPPPLKTALKTGDSGRSPRSRDPRERRS
jgi:hypothetical protein